MDFRDRVFLAVAEHLSFSKAGTALRISQPAVTRHIRELEAQLEVNLFERKGPRIKLTTAGELVYSHLKPIRALYRELLFDLEQAKGDYKGSLRVGASSTIAQYVIPPVLAAFYKRYRIDLTCSTAIRWKWKVACWPMIWMWRWSRMLLCIRFAVSGFCQR